MPCIFKVVIENAIIMKEIEVKRMKEKVLYLEYMTKKNQKRKKQKSEKLEYVKIVGNQKVLYEVEITN